MHPQWTNFNFGGNKFWFSQIKFVSLVRSGPYAALHTSCFTPHLPVCFFLRRCKPFPNDCFVSCMFPRHLERIFFVSWYLRIYFSLFVGQYIFVKFVFLFHKNLLLLHMLSRRIWVKRALATSTRLQCKETTSNRFHLFKVFLMSMLSPSYLFYARELWFLWLPENLILFHLQKWTDWRARKRNSRTVLLGALDSRFFLRIWLFVLFSRKTGKYHLACLNASWLDRWSI